MQAQRRRQPVTLRSGSTGEVLENTDETAARKEYLFRAPSWLGLERLLEDPRDLPLCYSLLNVLLTVPPAAALLFAAAPRGGGRALVAGAAYLVLSQGLFLQRFLLTLHFSQHRRLFRRGLGALNALPSLLCPFFGLPPFAYRLHHCVMHHGESNGVEDLSSTERYARDSPLALAHYMLCFAFASIFLLPLYGLRGGRRPALAASASAGTTAYFIAMRFAWLAAPSWALPVLVLPFAITQLALPLGNWCQHCLINPDCPRGAAGMTYTVINHADNQRTYNDGYHAEHHRDSRAHWSELPAAFRAVVCSGEAARADALVFSGIHFFDVGFACLGARWGGLDWLARRYVQVGQPARSHEELVAELRRRLAPIRQLKD